MGGGFLERQERASAATVEVTADGFDDFGRKKSNKSADKAAKEAAALATALSYRRLLILLGT